jgi:hypothetical protein
VIACVVCHGGRETHRYGCPILPERGVGGKWPYETTDSKFKIQNSKFKGTASPAPFES